MIFVFFGIMDKVIFIEFNMNFKNVVIWEGVVIDLVLWIVIISVLSRLIVLVIIWNSCFGVCFCY